MEEEKTPQMQEQELESNQQNEEFDIKVVCGPEETKDVHVVFNQHDHTVAIGSEVFPASQIRCVSDRPEFEHDILLSYRLPSPEDVFTTRFLRIRPEESIDSLKIITAFWQFKHCEIKCDKDIYEKMNSLQFMDYFAPKLIVPMKVSVNDAVPSLYTLIIDEECLCLLKSPYDSVPKHQASFWEDAGVRVVEKIVVTDNVIDVFTPTFKYKIHCGEDAFGSELLFLFRRIKPKPSSFFFDPMKLLLYLNEEGNAQQSSPLFLRPPSPVIIPRPARSSSWNTVDRDEIYYSRETSNAIDESSNIFFVGFKDDLDKGFNQAERDENFRSMWEPHDLIVKELLEVNLVGQKDPHSGGLDPNSVDHFHQSINDIDDKLFEQDYEGALCSLQALREIFSESKYPAVVKILEDDDYTLLKKLFFKNLYAQCNYESGEGASVQGAVLN